MHDSFEYLIFVFLYIRFRYVFGQYPRFLKGNWQYMMVVVKKLFDFMHSTQPGVKVILPFFFLNIILPFFMIENFDFNTIHVPTMITC